MSPFSGFESWDDCVSTMMDEEGHDEESAENICGALQAEEKADAGNPDELLDALERGAGLIADVGVDLVSGVDVPAVDSKWVMLKSGGARKGHDFRADVPVLLAKDDGESERRIAYAAAMIPREPDKEGDVVPTATVESAAHDFLKSDGGIDTDHSLIDGEGQPVESWVLKEERTFDLPGDNGTETYPAGTWMLGIEWGAEAWDRIKSGELSGLSIYGMAEHVPLERAVRCTKCGDSGLRAGGDTGDMGQDSDAPATVEVDADAVAEKMADPLTESVESAVADVLEAKDLGGDSADALVSEFASKRTEFDDVDKDADEVAEIVRSALETGKQDDAEEAASMLGSEFGMGAGDVMDILSAAADADADAVLDAIEGIMDREDGEDDEDEEDMEASAKNAGEANLSKGSDTAGTASRASHGQAGGSGEPSYAAIAEQHEAGD